MEVNLNFPQNYSIESTFDLTAGERYYYPGAITEGGRDGITVRIITSEGWQWVGVFAFGEIDSKSISGIYSTPDPDKFCVVARGAGYIVSSKNPLEYQEVNAIPVMDVRSVSYQNILVFADYTELVAYNEAGIKWNTKRLAYDGFKITEVTDYIIKGEFWNIQNEMNDIFEVNLANGYQTQGDIGI